MFDRLGRSAWRHHRAWILIWVALAAALALASPSAERLAEVEPVSLMPDDEPYNRALAFEREAFPELAFRTRTVLIFERSSGLTDTDRAYLTGLSRQLAKAADAEGWRVQSPMLQPYLTTRLLSADGQAAMIVLSSDVNYLTHHSELQVRKAEQVVRENLPEGLTFEVTGEGGLGRDLNETSERAYHRTTWVTVTALLIILALVYRSPLAALVPLVSVGMSVFAAISLLNVAALAGWGISNLEKTFVVVLLFGSGVDFSLFWMWRYREELSRGTPREQAFVTASATTGPAVATSAATTICGFAMLMAADLLPSHNAGRALAVSLIIALAAALTLVPAVAGLMGGALFWPQHVTNGPRREGSRMWTRAADLVTRRPTGVLLFVILLLAAPAWAGTQVKYRYDALGIVPDGSGSARGRRIAEEHFGTSQLFSWAMMIQAPELADDLARTAARSKTLSDAIATKENVVDVWSLTQPLGRNARVSVPDSVAEKIGRPFYLSEDPDGLRFEIILDEPPLSDRAMQSAQSVIHGAQAWVEENLGGKATIHATGLTPYILNIRSIAQADQRRVMLLAVVVIFLIVLGWVRHLTLTVCMLVATLGIYAATLGVTELFFVHVMGLDGIDWKVRLFVFVVLVAVGQDYNIFLVSRIQQERAQRPTTEAVRVSIVRTGAVISSCGLIMAATLGSLSAAGMPLLQELAFAFAFGVLLDTFVVRPLLIPAFYLLRHRREAPAELP